MSRMLVLHSCRSGHAAFVAHPIVARCHADLAHIEDITSRDGVLQSQGKPALRRFLLELKRLLAVTVSLPPIQDQAPA